MIYRIFLLLLAAGLSPLCAQSSLNNGGRVLPQDQQTIQPDAVNGPNTLQPGVDAPPPGVPAPGPEMPAPPPIHCRLKEFTVSPTVCREGVHYNELLRTTIALNVPAPRRMVFRITTSDPNIITCGDIVLIPGAQSGFGGIKIIWGAVHHDSKFEFKAFSVDEPDLVLHGRIYLKKQIE